MGADRLLIVDVDDTVLGFDHAFTDWAIRTKGMTGLKPAAECRNIEELFGLDYEASVKLIREFYRHEDFGRIAPLDCAAEVLPRLHREGWRFVAISAAENDPGIVEARTRNLREAFGFDFDAVHLSGLFIPRGKEPYLSQYDRAVWVEDNASHAVSGAEMGHRTMLIDRLSNRGFEHENVTRVRDWREIAELLGE